MPQYIMDLAYILTRKTPKSGGFGGLAHLYLRCPEPRPPAARAAAPALLGLGRLLAADDLVNEDDVAVLGTGHGEAHEHIF